MEEDIDLLIPGKDFILVDTVNVGPPFKVRCLSKTIDHYLVVNDFEKKTYLPRIQVVHKSRGVSIEDVLICKLPQYVIMEKL